MALITTRCSSRGASVIFTINDVTQRGTQVQWISASNSIRIVIFNAQGGIAAEINTGQDVSPKLIDIPAVLVQITRPDQSIKSYLALPFTVYF